MIKVQDLDTPTLLLDYKKVIQNISEVSSFANEIGVAVRPHIKTHKSIKIAELQLNAGAVGITVAKIGEAEVMAEGGIKDILVAYPIASPQKINRIIQLLKKGIRVKVAVDQEVQLQLLNDVLQHTSLELEVWIKVNSGLNRCGVEPGPHALKLAEKIMMKKQLKLGGIFTHAGHSYAAKSIEDIHKIGVDEGKAVVDSASECEKAGIPIAVRSVGSTPTYKQAGAVKGITEIRPGNAVFFDAIQVGLGVTTLERCALTLLASVVGVYQDRIVFDTGSKSLCLDKGAHGNETVKGYGLIQGHEEITLERLSEEHGVGVFLQSPKLQVNDVVQIIPNHACTVANMFNEYVVHEDGLVIDHWKVDARGRVK
ncbi:D-serine deaminase-like pyridoxal phosphate-dependent protein [Bacillus mesophilus]|uniref:D-TA family PLP-dependent enzyme n=1 Tax=Bacillus mesophilus TaxID=1808955 RepID=A0A6M0QA74_9BACI|nr:D-TA family PLP-dependent enzyme [Bacillus mesophilus]MBM7662666.1 D-serine deaminase-like pyridoxal phosphate-dependent protein [Bacillus mesophilus]NEY73271.1 D-TA family PLP-dependent enzyme [Bacillus mesophilus]